MGYSTNRNPERPMFQIFDPLLTINNTDINVDFMDIFDDDEVEDITPNTQYYSDPIILEEKLFGTGIRES